jgi:HEAT repeat protein
MRRAATVTTWVLGGLLARSAHAGTAATVAPSGGLDALAVTVDVAAGQVRYASCKGTACATTAASPTVAIPPGDLALEASAVTVTDVAVGGGRHLVHVKVPLGTEKGPESPAWEALFAAGSAPLFAGRTGWSRGEPGERSGTDVRLLTEGDHSVVVIGEIREDLRICGDDATLLDPRGLDPRTLVFHGATLQRLDAARRDAAIPIEATPRHGPREAALAPLLTATDASSGTAAALTDGDAATAWSEARPGRGQGEFVLLRTPFDVPIVRFAVTVAPTPPKSDGAAPETFYLATGKGTYEVTMPEDAWSHPGDAYDIALPEPLQTSCVAFVLNGAFTRGKAHPEVSVAELTAYSAFDHAGATLAEVAAALNGGDAKADAAAALLERAGAPGVVAMSTVYGALGASGRALAINVAASDTSCASSGKLLVAALGDADEVVREKAVSKLQEPTCGREALPALLEALETPGARAKVAPLVAVIGRERALGPLVGALGEGTAAERGAVRSAVAYAARRVTPDELATLLGASTRSPDASLELLRALDARLAEAAGPADARIAALLSGTPPLTTRYLLVDVIARLAAAADADAQTRLAELALHDEAREVRARATELLARTKDPEAVAAKALADADPRVREAALHAIGALHKSEQTAAIVNLLAHDPWTFVRVAAAEALATLPATAASDRALAEALDQLAPRVRQRAIVALTARGAKAYTGVIRDRLTNVKEDGIVRAASARAAGLLCDVKAEDLLAELAVKGGSSADAGDVTLGLVATAALGKLHPADLASRFAPLQSKGVRPDARVAAERALADPVHCPLP